MMMTHDDDDDDDVHTFLLYSVAACNPLEPGSTLGPWVRDIL